MPPVIGQPTAIGTLPHSLSTKFTQAHSVLMNMNQYHDLRSQRVALVTGGRRSWKISKRLDAHSLGLLRQFCYAAKGGAFYFYNPSETNPPYSNNPSGTAGRYLVRFNSDWSQTTGMSRSDTSIELIEVSEVGAVDIGAPIVPGSGPGAGGNDGGGGTTPPLLINVPINHDVAGGEWLQYNYQGFVGYGPIAYGGYLWTYGAASEFERLLNGDGTTTSTSGAGMYKSATGLTWTKQGGTQTFTLPFAAYWDPVAAKVTFLIDGFRGGTAEIVEFDMATESYGAVSTPSPDLDSPSSDPFRQTTGEWLHKLSDGTYRVLYGIMPLRSPDFAPTSAEIYYLDYSAGAWASPTLLAGSSGHFYRPFFTVQDGDTIHIFSGFTTVSGAYTNFSAAPAYKYWRLNPDGTTSTPVDLNAALTVQSNIEWNIEAGILSGDSILIPAWKFYTDESAPIALGVLIGTPKENPTFTWVQVTEEPINSGPNDVKLIRLGSTDYFGWVLYNSTTNNFSQIFLSKSIDHGETWSTPQLLLDLDATPPQSDADGYVEGSIPSGAGGYTRDIANFSFGTQLNETSLGLMYTSWATYWTNAPAFLP